MPTLSHLFSMPKHLLIQHTGGGGSIDWLILYSFTTLCTIAFVWQINPVVSKYKVHLMPGCPPWLWMATSHSVLIAATHLLHGLYSLLDTMQLPLKLLSMSQLCYHLTKPAIHQYSSYIHESRPRRYPVAIVLAFR